MPKFNQHLAINFVCLSAAEIARQLIEQSNEPAPKIDWGRYALHVGAGCVAGALPDILEPSLGNPNHRGFFHSLSAALIVWWIATGKHTKGEPVEFRRLLQALALGYTLHLGADLFLSKAKGMGLAHAQL
jgi:hypothetical protein